MKHSIVMVFLLMGLFIGIPHFALASGQTQEQIAEWNIETQGWSIQNHLAATKVEEEEVQALETRVQHLDNRMAHLEKKPHLDPKGIQRNALKLISSTLKEKTNLLNEKIAWHFRQADLAKVME